MESVEKFILKSTENEMTDDPGLNGRMFILSMKDDPIDDIIEAMMERRLNWIKNISAENVRKPWEDFHSRYTNGDECYKDYKAIVEKVLTSKNP